MNHILKTGAVSLLMLVSVAACTNTRDPGQRAAGGALIGAGAGAAIGGIAGGGGGAAVLGQLADETSIRFVYQVCAFLPAIGLLAVLLPNMRHART